MGWETGVREERLLEAQLLGNSSTRRAIRAASFVQGLWYAPGVRGGVGVGVGLSGAACGPLCWWLMMLLLVQATVWRAANASECLGEAAVVLDAMLTYYPPPACPSDQP